MAATARLYRKPPASGTQHVHDLLLDLNMLKNEIQMAMRTGTSSSCSSSIFLVPSFFLRFPHEIQWFEIPSFSENLLNLAPKHVQDLLLRRALSKKRCTGKSRDGPPHHLGRLFQLAAQVGFVTAVESLAFEPIAAQIDSASLCATRHFDSIDCNQFRLWRLQQRLATLRQSINHRKWS